MEVINNLCQATQRILGSCFRSTLNRFASADTIVPTPSNPQSYNRYSYSYNNPLKFIDPSGHFGICFQQGIANQSNSEKVENNTALTQMCTELAGQGFFGESGEFKVFGNDTDGIRAAVAYLREQMGLHPDESIFVMGFSYGGGGALDFVSLLNERGGEHLTLKDRWNDITVPEDVKIEGLILIDPVVTGRSLLQSTLYSSDPSAVPPNVKTAINLYATEDAYSGFVFDQGLQNIEGALNVGMAGTDHCSVAYSNCIPTFPNEAHQGSWPQQESPAGPINFQTLNLIKFLLSPVDLMN